MPSSKPSPSSSWALASAPRTRASRTTSKSGSRSSSYASRSSCSSWRVAAETRNRTNSSSPRCCRSRSSICLRLSSPPLQRCNATKASSSTCSCRCNRASTAGAVPSCTQVHRGSLRLVSPRITGLSTSSSLRLRELSDRTFSSSSSSGTKCTGPVQSASTAGTFRCCSAASNGVPASSVSALASAPAARSASMVAVTDSAAARWFIATRLSGVSP
mmetsp:Transcript_38743/g.110510  ORF Transcript_38743/g.110510 Transcript_38743/m.110510 type:complete len:216 (+) Transcript_38743:1098-1745(+)